MRFFSFLSLVFSFAAVESHAQSVQIGSHTVASWQYQLQGKRGAPIDLAQISAVPANLAVLDYSADGTADAEFTHAQIASLKAAGKVVLAYLSIGEAESYRFYWNQSWTTKSGRLNDGAPTWLARQDPDWPGNFKVRYWMPEWQQIIFGTASGSQKSYVDRVIDAGFDGVYLDIIDAFEYFGPDTSNHPERPTAAADMASFVGGIATYARSARGVSGFLVVPQNGANIVDELTDSQRADYFAAINAIGAEDTFFYGPLGVNNAWHPQEYTIACLEQFAAAARPVLAIEYVTQRAKAKRFKAAALARSWLPLVSTRALDRSIPQP